MIDSAYTYITEYDLKEYLSIYYLTLSSYYITSKDFEKALQAIENVDTKNSFINSYNYYYQLGIIYNKLNREQEYLSLGSIMTKINNEIKDINDENFYEVLVDIKLKQGKYNESIELMQKLDSIRKAKYDLKSITARAKLDYSIHQVQQELKIKDLESEALMKEHKKKKRERSAGYQVLV